MTWKLTRTMIFSAALLATNAMAADGDLDLSFGISGLARAGVTDATGSVRVSVVQRDGKIVTCDTHGFLGPTAYDFFVARFNADGTVDSTFGVNGTTSIDFGAKDYCAGVAVQPDGKVVVGGTELLQPAFANEYGMFAVARLNVDGTLDSTFGSGTGKATIQFDYGTSSAEGVALQPDGKIILAGRAKAGEPDYEIDFALARLMPDGSLDAGFGTAGKATVGFNDNYSFDYATSVAVDRHGRIILVGVADGDTGAARFLGNGSLDTTFGDSGRAFLGIAHANKVALQRDSKILVAGYTTVITNGVVSHINAAVMRLLENGTPDPGFGALGIAEVPFNLGASAPGDDSANDVIEQTDGKVVLVGDAVDGDTNYTKAVAARLDTAGELDASFGAGGKAVFAFGLSTPDSQWFSSVGLVGGRIIAAGSAAVSDSSGNTRDDVVVRLQNDLIFAHGFD